MRFEWDPDKNEINKRKHRISFETAQLVFSDPLHRSFHDGDIGGEERWQTYGLIEGIALVVVAHTYRQRDETDVIRIISARKATKHERRRYEED